MRSLFNKRKSLLKYGAIGLGLMLAFVAVKTYQDVKTPSLAIRNMVTPGERFAVLDRQGEPLGISFQTRFNMMDVQPLHQMPDILRKAFISAEDRRFRSASRRVRSGRTRPRLRRREPSRHPAHPDGAPVHGEHLREATGRRCVVVV